MVIMRAATAMGLALALVGSVRGDVSRTISFDAATVSLSAAGAYGVVDVPGWATLDAPGFPRLPATPVFVALPPGHEAVSVRVVPEDSSVVATGFVPHPGQPPAILPIPGKDVPVPAFRKPESSVYLGSTPYPRQLAGEPSTGYVAGVSVASAVVMPFRWYPREEALTFYDRVRIEVETRPSARRPLMPQVASPAGERFRQRVLAGMGISGHSCKIPVDRDAYDYLIVCARECSTAFAELADWKTRKGLRAVTVTRETIEATYPGEDVPAQIRACLQDYYLNHGVWCVLLGGDTYYLPCRHAWAMECEAGVSPDEDDIPADLYFADLDGTWDENGNGTYGEVADSVDLFPDLLVGRIPVNTPSQAQAVVSKSLEYETFAADDYQDRVLFCAEVLWNNPFTDGGLAKDLIDSLYFPAAFDPIQKLYETLGNESPASVIAALNDGRNLVNHNGHCWYTAMGVGTGMLGISDMDALTNAPRYGMLYSIGCWPAAIDYDCIAEHFVQNPSGGGVAFIGNSRYGWGSPGNPCYGYSDMFDQQFWRNAIVDGGTNAGAALAAGKAFFIPYSRQENVYRIHQYEVNLLGDPDLPVWTSPPGTPEVCHPAELALGQTTCSVRVSLDGAPVQGALVCLSQEAGEYVRTFTDASGTGLLPLSLASATDVDLTVTGHNLKPYTTTIPVSSTGAFLEVTSHWFVEAQLPVNGVPNPGEDLYVSICLENRGDEPSSPVSTLLRAPAGWITVTDSTETFLSVLAGQSVTRERAYRLTVASGVGLGHGCPLDLELSAGADTVRQTLPLVVAMPLPELREATVEDAGGGSQFDPGESAVLEVITANAGNDTAYALHGSLLSLDSWLTVGQDATIFGDMAPGEEAAGCPPFQLQLDSGSPSPRVAPVVLEFSDSRYAWQETLWIPVGPVGFEDDMELSNGGWACPGGGNHWHRSSVRSHSGTHAWYCGQDASQQYVSSSRDTLLSPRIVVGENAALSFWAWFDVTIYGTDGMYVEALGPQGWARLDYIGSGGALEGMLMGHDWAMHSYDLGWLEPGAETKVRFVFSSDGWEVAEGFYLDDVRVTPCTRDSVAGASGGNVFPPAPGSLRLLRATPNPSSTQATISYTLGAGLGGKCRRVTLTVYDGLGRLVAVPCDRVQPPGTHSVRWDLRTGGGYDVPPGLYFLRLTASTPHATDVRRLVVLR
jgi:hypothetical protein